jgi:hypothetical protein
MIGSLIYPIVLNRNSPLMVEYDQRGELVKPSAISSGEVILTSPVRISEGQTVTYLNFKYQPKTYLVNAFLLLLILSRIAIPLTDAKNLSYSVLPPSYIAFRQLLI